MVRAKIAAGILLCSGAGALGQYRITEGQAKGPGNPSLILLTDQTAGIEAAVAPSQGGELSGLKVRVRGRWVETLYRARDYTPSKDWTGKAPLLWPATGRNALAGESSRVRFGYEWGGIRRPMPIHGFARDLSWKVSSKSAGESGAALTLAVEDSPETRRYYPFGFRLEAAYRLAGGELAIVYTVRADAGNREPMPFSIGNHITFNAPLIAGTPPGEMRFQSPSTIEYLKRPPGLPSGERRRQSYAAPVRLADLPPRAAISLGGYRGDPYMVYSDPGGLAIRITHSASSIPRDPVILFNIWGDPSSGFFSPEPWVGLQNSLNLRQGLVMLAPGAHWSWTVRIRPQWAR